MDKLIEQELINARWKLVEHLHFLDHVMNEMLELEKMLDKSDKLFKELRGEEND